MSEPGFKEFKKSFDLAASVRHDRWRTFNDFLEMAFCTLAQRNGFCTKEDAETLEARYMVAIEPYKEHDARFEFAKMLGMVQLNIKDQDFLGYAAGALELLNEHMGQFFTPYEVSKLIAQMNLGGIGEQLGQRGYFTLAEPACGAGGMVLAAADVVEGMGHDVATSMLVHATDLSEHAFKMAYVQLSMRGVAARVVRGNTLSQEIFESHWTPGAAVFYDRHGHLFDEPPPARRRSRKIG